MTDMPTEQQVEGTEAVGTEGEQPQWEGRAEDRTDSGESTLLAQDTAERFRGEWEEIQRRFVDEPRDCVAQADTLVADLMQRLTAGFSNERSKLEQQWDRGDDVSTEELRVALTRYRAFFERLLAA
jgi:hypothetical protein